MRTRLLTMWLLASVAAFIFAGQTWWLVSVSGDSRLLPTEGSGFDSERILSAVLLFNLAVLLLALFSRGLTVLIFQSLGAVASAASLLTTASDLVSQNIGSLAATVSKQTGFEIDPILVENIDPKVSAEITIWPVFTVLAIALITVIQAILIFGHRLFETDRARSKQTAKNSENARYRRPSSETTVERQPEDPISLWDSQSRR